MALSDVLSGLFWGTRTATQTKAGSKYRVISRSKSRITVRAPSGSEALRIAGMDGHTIEGESFGACNHKGGGVYEIRIEPWPPKADGLTWKDAPRGRSYTDEEIAWDEQAYWELERGINPYRKKK